MVADLGRRALDVAPELLGRVLWVRGVGVRITEVEAYEGADDPASHAWRGQTLRNQVMFGPAGHLYTYSIHGHTCCNVVCGPVGTASAVLIRAAEVVEGIEFARARRPRVADVALARGPGNLCRALGVRMTDLGASLMGPEIVLRPGRPVEEVKAGPRVNVSRAWEQPWRFSDATSPTVSAYKRHPATRSVGGA